MGLVITDGLDEQRFDLRFGLLILDSLGGFSLANCIVILDGHCVFDLAHITVILECYCGFYLAHITVILECHCGFHLIHITIILECHCGFDLAHITVILDGNCGFRFFLQKINVRNAFSLHLIDTMKDIIKKEETNFQVWKTVEYQSTVTFFLDFGLRTCELVYVHVNCLSCLCVPEYMYK